MIPIDRFPFRAVIAFTIYVVVIFWMAIMGGCKTGQRVPSYAAPVQSAPVLAGQEGKDSAVLSEAAKIDAIAPDAKPHTDAQRAAVAAAPAADVAKLAADYEAIISKLTKERDALKDAELRAQVRTMRWFGFACLLAAIALGYARQIHFAIVSAGLGVLSLGAAQLWASVASHPLFQPILGGSIVLGLGGLAWAAVHAYKKGDLTTKALREKERLTETLAVIVPALDEAKSQLGEAFNPVISNLGRKMNDDHKKIIKAVRATV